MADISGPALEKAKAKVLQLVPDAPRVETKVTSPLAPPFDRNIPPFPPSSLAH